MPRQQLEANSRKPLLFITLRHNSWHLAALPIREWRVIPGCPSLRVPPDHQPNRGPDLQPAGTLDLIGRIFISGWAMRQQRPTKSRGRRNQDQCLVVPTPYH